MAVIHVARCTAHLAVLPGEGRRGGGEVGGTLGQHGLGPAPGQLHVVILVAGPVQVGAHLQPGEGHRDIVTCCYGI